MPTCYILIGLPGVGKSTWLQESQDFIPGFVSSDAIIENIARELGYTYDDIFSDIIKFADRVFWDYVKHCGSVDGDFAVDRTNLSRKSRKKIMDALPGYEFVAVEFAKPDETEWRRRLNSRKGKTIPEHVLRSMESSYQPATLEEGFKEVIQVNEQ
jgi:predicted kinase